MPDAIKNFAYSTVDTAPSPADSGTSLTVQSGHGTRFPTSPFNAVVWPANQLPLSTNAEIVRVTNISADTFTIERTQESSSARSIQVGDQIAQNLTAKTITDLIDSTQKKTFVTVGAADADYITDGIADDVQIQEAIDDVATAGGGIVWIKNGVYNLADTITIPFDAKVRLVGERFAKQNSVGTTLKAAATLTNLFSMSGNSNPAANTDLSHDFSFEHLTINGNSTTTNLIHLSNVDFVRIQTCRLIAATNSIVTAWDSTSDPDAGTIPGGLYIRDSIVSANSGIGIDMQYQTQCWIDSCWFSGTTVAEWIRLNASNKIKISNCEFNTAGIGLHFQDTATMTTNNIVVSNCMFEVGSGNKAWDDDRTNASSVKVSITGCTLGSGVTTDTLVNSGNIVLTSATPLPSGTIVGTTDTQTLSGKTLTEPKIAHGGFIADANGNEALKFNTTTNAVNEITIQNAATGGRPLILASGSDGNVGLDISTQVAGPMTFWVAGRTIELLKLIHNSSAVNEVQIANAATGNAPTISVTGNDTNINLALAPKGTGVVTAPSLTVSSAIVVPNAAGGTTVDAAGELTVDTTSATLNFHDGTAERVLNPIQSKSITIESPTSSEDIGLFYTDEAITITKIVAVQVGTTPSVTYTIRHGTDRSAAGAEVVTGGSTTTSTTTGDVVTSFNDATVVADSHVWLETTAQSGTSTSLTITIFYRQDA